MKRTISLITAVAATALIGVPSAWGQSSPDAFERAVSVETRSSGSVYQDAFERAVAAQRDGLTARVGPDAFERALGNQSVSVSESVLGDRHDRVGSIASPVLQDHLDRVGSPQTPPVTPLETSSRDIQWPQIGIGFGMGALLAIGLFLTLRLMRERELAH